MSNTHDVIPSHDCYAGQGDPYCIAVRAPASLDRDRVEKLLERERSRYVDTTPASRRAFESARRFVAGGVTSSFQAHAPHPLYLEGGRGARVQSVDGTELVDFHMGYGTMVVGHAHPRLQRVLRESAGRATHLGAPTLDSLPVAEELQRRFGLERWRFCNSGTEATMAGLRLARAATGRQLLVKIVGVYFGHHDPVMTPPARGEPDPGVLAEMGLATQPPTLQVPFNDVPALERVISEHGADIACLLLELPMLAPFPCLPAPGYVEAVRALTREHEVLLLLDEAKTGVTIAAGGATELYRPEADIVTLAKAIGGGLPIGAIGATEVLMARVADGQPPIYGTFNGNPLVMATSAVALTEILTPTAYQGLGELGRFLGDSLREIAVAAGLPATVVTAGSRGGICMTAEPVSDYWEWERLRDVDLTELLWLYQVNRGVYLSPAPRLHWTLSTAHTADDVNLFVANLAAASEELAA